MDIKSLKIEPFTSSKYIKPKRYTYKKGGELHSWDFIEQLDSVSILLYHTQYESFIFVKQFRIPLFDYQMRNNAKCDSAELGYTIELCSGLVDKPLSVADIAKEECFEELGYLPPNIEKIADFYSGFGSGCAKQTLFFAEVKEADKKGIGGGVDDEEIEAVFVPVKKFESYIKNVIHAASLEFAYLWFIKNKIK